MHATRARLSLAPSLSAVHRGAAFENRSLTLLQTHMSMSLRRVGGKSDGGVDLQGWWWLPDCGTSARSPRRRLRVLAQCKAEKKSMGPNYVREMEGVLHRYASHTMNRDIQDLETHNQLRAEAEDAHRQHDLGYPAIALVISESRFTPATMLRAQSSPVPFFLLHLPAVPDETSITSENEVGAAILNSTLQNMFQKDLEVRVEHSLSNNAVKTLALWWRGEPLRNWVPDTLQPMSPDEA